MPCDKDFGYVRLTRELTVDIMVIYDMIPKANMYNHVKNHSSRSSNNLAWVALYECE